MTLSNCNIQDLVTTQIKDFLLNNQLSFHELKALITEKKPIPDVQDTTVKILLKMKTDDLTQVKTTLENQAYSVQKAEDAHEKKLIEAEASSDKEIAKRLTREYTHIPILIASHNQECTLLRNQLADLIQSLPAVVITHSHQDKLNSSQPAHNKKTRIEHLQKSITQFENKIKNLSNKHQHIHSQLTKIKERTQARLGKKESIDAREEAYATYLVSGIGFMGSLSKKNQIRLANRIKDQQHALESKCIALIEDAQAINFAFFIGLLPNHWSNLSINHKEGEAVRMMVKLMKHHLHFEQQIATTQESLDRNRVSLTTRLMKLSALNDTLDSLTIDKSLLAENNKRLLLENKACHQAHLHHRNLKNQLGLSTLITLGNTFIFSIPLFLAHYGSLPFIISPLLLSALPGLLLLATIAVSIAALVYGFKAKADFTSIQWNLATIHSNNNHVKKNQLSIEQLQTRTIPKLERHMREVEITRSQLIDVLEESKVQAEQSIKQAKGIIHLASSGSGFFNSPRTWRQRSTNSSDDAVNGIETSPVRSKESTITRI